MSENHQSVTRTEEYYAIRLPNGELFRGGAQMASRLSGRVVKLDTAEGNGVTAWTEQSDAMVYLGQLRDDANDVGTGPEFAARAELVEFTVAITVFEASASRPFNSDAISEVPF